MFVPISGIFWFSKVSLLLMAYKKKEAMPTWVQTRNQKIGIIPSIQSYTLWCKEFEQHSFTETRLQPWRELPAQLCEVWELAWGMHGCHAQRLESASTAALPTWRVSASPEQPANCFQYKLGLPGLPGLWTAQVQTDHSIWVCGQL